MCRNEVTFYVARGYDSRAIELRCGNTDPHGGTVICKTCLGDPNEMRRIREHKENVAADNAWLRSANWGEM